MKMKFILIAFVQLVYTCCYSQYIGVKARYTETRLVDDSPNPPKRQNRLILSFYEVNPYGVYTPVSLTNYDIWVYKEGFQYGSCCGGVLDSTGNNYPGYSWPAPKAVAYYNSYNLNWIDCDGSITTHYIVNGHELDCGFIGVSHWEMDYGTNQAFEAFTAPNICLPYYLWPHPYASMNYNFSWPVPPTPPYNWYSLACYNSTQQLIIRGVLAHDTALTMLPVRFDNVKAVVDQRGIIKISWSNLTESNINYYEIEKSLDGRSFHTAGLVFPLLNNGGRADYVFPDNNLLPGEKLFYRIKAIETSGHSLFSQVLSVSFTNSKTPYLKVYPNPVINHQLNFQLINIPAGQYSIVLINSLGQEDLKKEIQLNGGSIVQSINLFNLSPGYYYLIVRSTDKIFSEKIIIRN